VGLDAISEMVAATEELADDRMDLIGKVLARGCCREICEAVAIILSGQSQREAAARVGWTPVRLSRALAELGHAITGHRPARYRRRALESAQLPLWGGC
jgi:hypothetical protein